MRRKKVLLEDLFLKIHSEMHTYFSEKQKDMFLPKYWGHFCLNPFGKKLVHLLPREEGFGNDLTR